MFDLVKEITTPDGHCLRVMNDTMHKGVTSQELMSAFRAADTLFKSHSFFNEALNELRGLESLRNVGFDETLTYGNFSKIIVVGCGGTGSWLIPKLVKTINDMGRKGMLANNFEFVLIDGDTVNCFSIGRV